MALNRNSNAYTIIYTIVMVVIVGALLATVATVLKPAQEDNVLNEQKTNIMKAFGDENGDFNATVEVGVLKAGKFEAREAADVFKMISDRKALAAADDELPLFRYKPEFVKDGQQVYVLPLVGKGLWGDIWGYVSLKQVDGNLEVAGIVMDHAGETPGLGAEIATARVQGEFTGKLVYADDVFALKMLKNGKDNKAYIEGSSVDAISGGTKTCDGVNAMLESSIEKYKSFLLSVETEAEEDTTLEEADEQPENVEPENL